MAINRNKRFHAEVATSSLSDIMFFLLLFFLIISTLANPNVIRMTLPKSKTNFKQGKRTELKACFAIIFVVFHYIKTKTKHDNNNDEDDDANDVIIASGGTAWTSQVDALRGHNVECRRPCPYWFQ